jgi:hypothetical protein
MQPSCDARWAGLQSRCDVNWDGLTWNDAKPSGVGICRAAKSRVGVNSAVVP